MTERERIELIARYRAGYGALLDALAGHTPAELDWRPSPEAWSVRDVVHHLEDAELTGAVRLRRLLTEDAPFLPAFDEEVYRQRLATRRARSSPRSTACGRRTRRPPSSSTG